MKKPFTLILLTFLTISLLSSCSDDNDPIEITLRLNQTQIPYDQEGVWQGVATDNPIQSQYILLSHAGEISPWGLVWSGFTPARISTTQIQTSWTDHQFQIMTGGGISGTGTPYLVAYWNTQENETTPSDSRSCRITYSKTPFTSPQHFAPQSVYVTNTAYTYYTMLEGSSFSRKFQKGDYLILRAHGVHPDNTESTTDFYLADCRSDDPSQWFLTDWRPFALSPLGQVKLLYFTMESSDTGRWGMNTPSMFAIDALSIIAVLPE